jgi:hypothetical protein
VGGRARDVRQDLAILFPGGKCVQKASNVDFIPGEVPAYGVGINGDAHYNVPV